MHKNKDGEIVLETEAEVRNYMRSNFNREQFEDNARKRNLNISIGDRRMTYNVLKKAINRFLGQDPQYRKEHRLLSFVLDASAKHGVDFKDSLRYVKHEFKWTDEEIKTAWCKGFDIIMKWLDSRVVKPTAGELLRYGT